MLQIAGRLSKGGCERRPVVDQAAGMYVSDAPCLRCGRSLGPIWFPLPSLRFQVRVVRWCGWRY